MTIPFHTSGFLSSEIEPDFKIPLKPYRREKSINFSARRVISKKCSKSQTESLNQGQQEQIKKCLADLLKVDEMIKSCIDFSRIIDQEIDTIKNSNKKVDETNDLYNLDLLARQKFIDKATAVVSKNIELLDQLFKLP